MIDIISLDSAHTARIDKDWTDRHTLEEWHPNKIYRNDKLRDLTFIIGEGNLVEIWGFGRPSKNI